MKKISRKRINAFIEEHATDELTLEIGSKTAQYIKFFPNCVRLDIKKYSDLNVLADAHALPFKSSSFSTILCIETLEHCRRPQQIFDEFHRVLKPGGTVILTTRFIFPIHDAPDDYFRFTKYGLKMLAKHFSSCEIEEEANSLSTIAILLQRIILQSEFRSFGWFWKSLLNTLILFFLIIHKVIKHGYGDSSRSYQEHSIMTSGYHTILKK